MAGTREVIKMHGPPGTVRSPNTWLPELLGPGKNTERMPNRVSPCGVPKNLNLSSLDLGNALNALDSGHAEYPGA